MGEVLPDVNMLGSLSPTSDVVSPLYAGCVVLKHRCGVPLSEAESVEEASEIQDIHSC